MINLLFPNLCHICHRPLVKGEKILCTRCKRDLPRTDFHLKENNPVEMRLFGKCDFIKCTSFCYYRKGDSFTKLIHQFKYNGFTEVGYGLAGIFARELMAHNWQNGIEAIVPVPLHPFKRFMRGYDQTKILANAIGKSWNIPVSNDIIRKTKYNTTQTKKSLIDRYENSKECYIINPKAKNIPKHILLVDDVFTSESTIESCIHLFDHIPQMKISVLTIGFAE